MSEELQKLIELLDSNPAVDKEQLAQFAEELKKIRVFIEAKQYRLASPVERRHIIVGENEHSDPRTVRPSSRR